MPMFRMGNIMGSKVIGSLDLKTDPYTGKASTIKASQADLPSTLNDGVDLHYQTDDVDTTRRAARIRMTYSGAAAMTAGQIKGADIQVRGKNGMNIADAEALLVGFIGKGSSTATTMALVTGVRSELDLLTNDVCTQWRAFHAQLSGGTPPGNVTAGYALYIENPNTCGNLFAMYCPDDSQVAKSTVVPTTLGGWIKVKIGTATRYIGLYAAPS